MESGAAKIVTRSVRPALHSLQSICLKLSSPVQLTRQTFAAHLPASHSAAVSTNSTTEVIWLGVLFPKRTADFAFQFDIGSSGEMEIQVMHENTNTSYDYILYLSTSSIRRGSNVVCASRQNFLKQQSELPTWVVLSLVGE